MAEERDSNVPAGQEPGRLAVAGLKVAAGLLALLVLAWVLLQSWELLQWGERRPASYVGAAALLAAGLGFSVLLWGAAELVHRVLELAAMERSSSGSAAPLMSDTPTPLARLRPKNGRYEAQMRLLEELVHLMRELRDIELLSEPERAARLKAESAELVERLERDIPALLREHNLQEAHQRLQRARQRFPNLPNWTALSEQIEQARAKFEAHDLSAATREVDDLAALGAWDRAAEVVRNLRQRHPDAEQVAELARRVALGQERARAEEKARLMSQAQDAANRRDWNRALELAQAVIEHFPGSPEAQELRLQLPTLRANVEIHKRQQMEATIRELVRGRRFREALRVAHELIELYPDSPQAKALREQVLPGLQQRAAQAAS